MWSSDKLKQLIEANGFDSTDFNVSIQSIFRTIEIYEYHKSEAYRLIQALEPKSCKEALKLVLEPHSEFYFQKLAVQAHVQSAIHNARALYDLIAQLLNKLLLGKPLPIYKCNIQLVADSLDNSDLKSLINSVIEGNSYNYTKGFVNIIKHRNLVELNSQVNFDELKAGIRFNAFKYGRNSYPSLWAEDALQKSLDVKNSIILIGKSLELHLSKRI